MARATWIESSSHPRVYARSCGHRCYTRPEMGFVLAKELSTFFQTDFRKAPSFLVGRLWSRDEAAK